VLCLIVLFCVPFGSAVAAYDPTNKQVADAWQKTIDEAIKNTKTANGVYIGAEGVKLLLRGSLYYQMANCKDKGTLKAHATINAVTDLATIIMKLILGGLGGLVTTLPNFIDMLSSFKITQYAEKIAKNNVIHGVKDLNLNLISLLLAEKGLYMTAKGFDFKNNGKGWLLNELRKGIDEDAINNPNGYSGLSQERLDWETWGLKHLIGSGLSIPGNIVMRLGSFAFWIARLYYEGKYTATLLETPVDIDDEK
jgi:hypothetical protein